MIIDHIGIVVRSIDKGIEQWKTVFGYTQYTEIVENTRQKVRVVFMQKKNSLLVKLLEPSNDKSPIYEFSKRGGGLHHLCFKCDNVDNAIESLKGKKMRLITRPEPGEAFNNEMIAFMLGQNGLNVELIDTDLKSCLIRDGINIKKL